MDQNNIPDYCEYANRKFRLGVYRYDTGQYEIEPINDFSFCTDRELVKDVVPSIPKSYIEGLGEELFYKLLMNACRIMERPSCNRFEYVFSKLNKLIRKIRSRLGCYLSFLEDSYLRKRKNRGRKFNRHLFLRWFNEQLSDLMSRLWRACQICYRQMQFGQQVLNASTVE